MTEYINIIGSDNQEEFNVLFEQFYNSLASKNIYLPEQLFVSAIRDGEVKNSEIRSNIVNAILQDINNNQLGYGRGCFDRDSFEKSNGHDRTGFDRGCPK